MKFGNALKQVQGEERTGDVPQWGRGIIEGCAVVGRYIGHDSYQTQDKDQAGNPTGDVRTVTFIKLVDVIKFTPSQPGAEDGTTEILPLLGVPLNADTRNKLDPATIPQSAAVLVQFTHTEPTLNNMRRFRVELLTQAQFEDLMGAAKVTANARR